jgi:hypothetical protein
MFRPIYVSATQIDAYRSCPRKWWFRSVRKHPEPKTDALIFGDQFSKAVEARLRGQAIPKFNEVADATIERLLSAASSFYPEPLPGIFPERKIEFDLDGAAKMVGYIDLLDLSGPEMHIRDHKTRAAARYAPSQTALTTDLQLTIYAHAIMREYPDRVFGTVGHINYIKPPKGKEADLQYIRNEWEPDVFLRSVPLDRPTVETTMRAVKSDVAAMSKLADTNIPVEAIPYDQSERACFQYNKPCAYCAICPRDFMLKMPPPPPSNNPRPANAPPPPLPPVNAPLPQSRPANAPPPPLPPVNAPPPPPARPANAPPPPLPAVNAPPPPPARPANAPPPPELSPTASALKLPSAVLLSPSVQLPEDDLGVNPFDPLEFPPTAKTPQSYSGMPLEIADIPGISARAVKKLGELGVATSLEVAHITQSYLVSWGVTAAMTKDILAQAEKMRSYHGIQEADPWNCCPQPEKEAVASPHDMVADLPAHPGTPPLATDPVVFTDTPAPLSAPPAVISAAPELLPNGGFVLYLECSPIKGAAFITLEEWLEPVFKGIEHTCGVQHWRSVLEFGRAAEMFHAAVKNAAEGKSDLVLPKHLVVLSCYSDYAKSTLDVLLRYATIVVRR